MSHLHPKQNESPAIVLLCTQQEGVGACFYVVFLAFFAGRTTATESKDKTVNSQSKCNTFATVAFTLGIHDAALIAFTAQEKAVYTLSMFKQLAMNLNVVSLWKFLLFVPSCIARGRLSHTKGYHIFSSQTKSNSKCYCCIYFRNSLYRNMRENSPFEGLTKPETYATIDFAG